MKLLIVLAVVAMASAQARASPFRPEQVQVVDNNPHDPSQVQVVDNNPQDPSQVQFAHNNPYYANYYPWQVQVADPSFGNNGGYAVDPGFYRPSLGAGGVVDPGFYQPGAGSNNGPHGIDISPAYVDNRPQYSRPNPRGK
ncbi:uncharacterized protein LOC126972026 isoform X9 [Leptidea sinapis]|uniref:uncharacterized protein LOC126972026 isoform X8 n=1 Tax=Leptidea sinapis TaxID=189913 RepID=UPI0021C38C7D|nr:uncharacterized protein LOC126972026 isoform X8 [Leptidea sinapis]XP_050674543.1 uncharacterized protein LOC126972026 isoform X9 [Leptidea sinapis]